MEEGAGGAAQPVRDSNRRPDSDSRGGGGHDDDADADSDGDDDRQAQTAIALCLMTMLPFLLLSSHVFAAAAPLLHRPIPRPFNLPPNLNQLSSRHHPYWDLLLGGPRLLCP